MTKRTFSTLRRRTGIAPRSATWRPRLHDLRHTFAVRTLLDAYRSGEDVQRRVTLLSTYLGHARPEDSSPSALPPSPRSSTSVSSTRR